MRHKCPKNEPENRLFTTEAQKAILLNRLPCLMMRHLCPIVRHRGPPETLRKFAGKSEKRSEIREMAGNCLSGASAGPRFGLAPAIARGKSLNCAPEPSAHFPTVVGQPRGSRPESQAFRGSRRRSTCRRPRRKFHRHFRSPRRPPAPTPAGDVSHGTFLSHERTRF